MVSIEKDDLSEDLSSFPSRSQSIPSNAFPAPSLKAAKASAHLSADIPGGKWGEFHPPHRRYVQDALPAIPLAHGPDRVQVEIGPHVGLRRFGVQVEVNERPADHVYPALYGPTDLRPGRIVRVSDDQTTRGHRAGLG